MSNKDHPEKGGGGQRRFDRKPSQRRLGYDIK